MNFRCSQLVCAVILEVTNRQSSSRQASRKIQSSHDTWFGTRRTGPGASSTPSLKARKRNRRRSRTRKAVFIEDPFRWHLQFRQVRSDGSASTGFGEDAKQKAK